MKTGYLRRAVGLARLEGLLWAVLLAFLLTSFQGCGYHLRGAGTGGVKDLPPLAIQGGREDGVRLNLERILTSAKIPPLDDPAKATIVIRIRNEQTDQLTLSVDKRAKVREYELAYTVVYDLLQPGVGPLQQNRRITLTRIYAYNETEVLGKDEQRQDLERSMRQAAAQRILRDLYTVQIREPSAAKAAANAPAETAPVPDPAPTAP